MPELPEIHYYSYIINKSCKDRVFTGFTDYTNKFSLPFKKFKISSEPHGKELIVKFESADVFEFKTITYYFTHGLSGRWEFTDTSPSLPKSILIEFYSKPYSLFLIDHLRMSKWSNEGNKKRSPDPVLEFDKFVQHVYSGWRKHGNKSIAMFLKDQSFFNGIGNYLRCEIMYRAAVSPFKTVKDVFKDTPSYIDLDNVNNNSDVGSRILYLCNQIPQEILKLGLNKYGTSEQVEKFNSWLRIYNKGTTFKCGGQQVYYSNEQVSGTLKPDLPEPIKSYPLENHAIKISKLSQVFKTTPKQSLPTTNFKKMETKNVNLLDLLEKKLPPLTLLLIIIRELQNKGHIDLVKSLYLRRKALEYDNVLFSILEVFCMTRDESELIDSISRM